MGRTAVVPILAVGIAAFLVGCESEPLEPPERVTVPDIESFLTEDVQALLDPSGRFPTTPETRESGTISPAEARNLARAYVLTFADFFRPRLEAQVGGFLDLQALEPSERAYYAASPYEANREGLLPPDRKLYGSWYNVPMLSNGRVVLTVAVSAFNSDIYVQDDRIILPRIQGNSFRMTGLSPRSPYDLPLSPEQAVYFAATRTGVRVSALPVLILLPAPKAPTTTIWRCRLEQPVRFRDAVTGRSEIATVVYVASALQRLGTREMVVEPLLLRPDRSQPDSLAIRYMTDLPDVGGPLPLGTAYVPRVAEIPVNFRQVNVES